MTSGRSWMLAALLAAVPSGAWGQVVEVQGGVSSLFGAQGGTIDARGGDTDLSIGAGTLHDQFAVGFRLQRTYRMVRFTAGDDVMDFQLPTDITVVEHYLPVRGASAELNQRGAWLKVFGGEASTTVGAPFFRGAVGGQPLALVFADVPEGPHWRFVSRNAFTDRTTSIQSVEWRKDASLAVAASAGLGSDHPYAASSLVSEQDWMSARIGYTARSDDFRRIDVSAPMAAEVERENIALTFRPEPWWSVSASRQHLVDAEPSTPQVLRATVDQVGGTLNVADNRFGATVFDSWREGQRNLGFSATPGRQLTERIDAGVDYFRDVSSGEATESVSGRVQEAVHPRLSLSQFLTYNDGGWSVNAGGQFISNVVTLGIGYQTTYAPFRPLSPFVRAVALDARIQAFGLEVHAGTYVSPDGHLRYTVSGGRAFYRGGGSGAAPVFKMGAYLVRGTVRDESGRGVEGAVLAIDKEIAITDQAGRFYVRGTKPRTAAVVVRTDEPSALGLLDVVSAPARAQFAPESSADEIAIVVRIAQNR